MESSLPIAPDAKGNVVVFIPFRQSMIKEKVTQKWREVDGELIPQDVPAPANLQGMAAFMKTNFFHDLEGIRGKNRDREFTVVTHPADGQLDEATRAKLGALGPNDTLYIMGHGGVGSPLIDSNLTGGDKKESLDPQRVLERMSAAGVSPNVGKIKLFSCHSAEGPEPANTFLQAFDAERQQPVAADAPSYAGAELTGYNHSLSTMGPHKTASVRDAMGRSTPMGRASENAVHIPQRPR